jgi:hypothetical protein
LRDKAVYNALQASIECAEERRSCPVFEESNSERPASFEDRRMWRLLLARLHPDAGGDHALFAFASSVRDEISAGERAAKSAEDADSTRRVAPFLRTWQEAMGHWSVSNRDAVNSFRKS